MSERTNIPLNDAELCRLSDALSCGLDAVREVLAVHDMSLGRTTPKNCAAAKELERQAVELEWTVNRLKALRDNKSGDWPEDFEDENGRYYCRCHSCGKSFMGYKRRVTCKLCATAPAPTPKEPAK